MKENRFDTVKISFAAMMAAMVYVVTLFRFPLLGSKVHFANAVCLVSGLLLGPVTGGLSAGLGSALYDALAGGYDIVNVLITFVSKFAMAFVCGVIAHRAHARKGKADRTVLASVAGALTYVALYMLKTFIYNRFVYGYPMDAVGATMVSKLIPSLINAGVAVVAAPVFYHAVVPALRTTGLLNRMQPQP
ncbi:MAG: ECF transporter S component [Clostridia bacterium]|nr:ECF transporter S component [Clostridia bacterium]